MEAVVLMFLWGLQCLTEIITDICTVLILVSFWDYTCLWHPILIRALSITHVLVTRV